MAEPDDGEREADYWFRRATELHGAIARIWAQCKWYDVAPLGPQETVERVERAESALQRIRQIVSETVPVSRE